MKKIAITACAIAMATCAFAQKKNVSGAEGLLYESDYKGARAKIEAAMSNPETSNWVKTYVIAGDVYYKLYEKEEQNRMTNQPYSQEVEDECLVKSIDAYMKAAELDVLPNEKGQVKPKYLKDVKKNLKQYSSYLINAGYSNYQANNYNKAVDLWGKYLEVPNHSSMAGEPKDTMYNEIKYYTIDALSRVEGKEDLSIKYMEELKKDNYKAEEMYNWLVGAYSKKGDTEKMLATLKEGVVKYPTNAYLMGNLINYYLENNKDNEAVAYLDEAISKEPNNAQYYVIKSQLFLKKENFEQAIKEAKQAISIDGNNFNANYFCGIAYLKQSEAAADKASKIKNNAQYQAAIKKANASFADAIPFLEKARSINPSDVTNLTLLKTCYYRVGNGKKYDEINKEINKLK